MLKSEYFYSDNKNNLLPFNGHIVLKLEISSFKLLSQKLKRNSKMKKTLLISFLAIIISTKAQTCFTTVNYSAGSSSVNSKAIASADFNNDGKFDLVVANYIFSGDGVGGFVCSNIPVVDSASGQAMICADFNNDGNADIALAEYGNSGLVKVVFGNGTGIFPTSNSFSVGSYPSSICSADFNGDGKVDLATANEGMAGTVSVLIGDGTGNFSPNTDFFVGSEPQAVTSGDFNGDGNADLAVAKNGNGGGTDSVAVLLGNGAGGFGTAIKYLAGDSPYSVCSKDFNADGYADIAVANVNSNTLSVLLSQGINGLFNTSVNYTTGSQPFSVISADFNSDGNPDLASANHGGNGVSILLGSVTGSFGPPSNFTAYAGPWTIISSDFNSDGRPDIATANHDYDIMSVLLNTVPTNCIGCALNSSVEIPNICMVTTDSATNYNYNVVYWDKTLYTNVDSFIVYRKDATSSNYLRIGSVSKDSISEFIDTCFSIGGPNGGNPQYSSWLYKLSIRDTCGNIGTHSPYHQSMFAQENGSNFSWNEYAVETGQTNPVTGYSFLRDDNNSGNWHVLVNTSSTSSTDPNFASFPSGNWRIDALGFNCNPTRTQTNSVAKSNTTRLIQTGLPQLSNSNFKLCFYPNPATNTLTITSINCKTIIRLFDTLGKLTLEKEIESNVTFDIGYLPQGIYTLVAENLKGKVFNKLVLTK
jgi:hypothetical protein